MGLIKTVSGICWKCTEKDFGPDYMKSGNTSLRMFDLTRGMVTRNSPTGIKVCDVRDVFECRECGELVPLESWKEYQSNGEIIIKKRGDRK